MGQIKSHLGTAQEHMSALQQGGGVNHAANLDGSSHYQGNNLAKEHLAFTQESLSQLVEAIDSAGNDIQAIALAFEDIDNQSAQAIRSL